MRQRREADWERIVVLILLCGAAVVPIAISLGGDDHFRLPKQLVMYAVAIAAAAVALMGLVLRKFDVHGFRIPLLLSGIALAWGVLTTLTSTHRALSADALLWGASLLIVFVLGVLALHRAGLMSVAIAALLPALVNATIVLLQASHVWNPWVFPPDTNARLMKNALLGNPDIVGVYLATATLFAAALALSTHGGRRIAFAAIALYLGLGVLASETLTSIAALGMATLALFITWRARTGAVIATALLITTTIAFLAYPPTRRRISTIAEAARASRWDHVITGRVVPFATAWHMFTDRPLLGMGPGAFKFHYMRYRVEVREERAELFEESVRRPINFGEVHSDHLQALAEVGLPGYILLLAGIAFIASRSWRPNEAPDERQRLAALLSAPLMVFLLITMLAQFPLQVAAPALTIVFLAAVCVAWSEPDAA